MRVFFSHSGHDKEWILSTVEQLQRSGIEVYAFEYDAQPGRELINKIQAALNSSDIMVAFITRHSVSSNWVQQEIGWALSGGKLVIPLVEDVVDRETAMAMLDGIDFIPFNAAEPQRAFDELKIHLSKHALQHVSASSATPSEMPSTTSDTRQHWTPPLLTMTIQVNVDVVLGMVLLVLGAYLLYVGVQEVNAASAGE